MSTITKERVAQFIKNPLDNGLTRGEQMGLARIALASLEAEPVAYMIGGHYLMHAQDPKVDNYASAVPLYTAPPAPVSVPDQWNKSLQEMVDAMRQYEMDIDEDAPHKHRAMMRRAEELLANRAAMLQGADGSSPVVPDGWVMVPVEPTHEMQSAAACAIRFDTTPINKLWTGNAVYRAMLAAAPQQEVKNG